MRLHDRQQPDRLAAKPDGGKECGFAGRVLIGLAHHGSHKRRVGFYRVQEHGRWRDRPQPEWQPHPDRAAVLGW